MDNIITNAELAVAVIESNAITICDADCGERILRNPLRINTAPNKLLTARFAIFIQKRWM